VVITDHAWLKNMNSKRYRLDIILIYLTSFILISIFLIITFNRLISPFKTISTVLIIYSGLLYESLSLKEYVIKIKDNGIASSFSLALIILLTVFFNVFRIFDLIPYMGKRIMFIIGLMFFISALLLRIAARAELKDYFTYSINVVKDQKLIKSGIYRIIRHPAYLGTMLFILSLSFLFVSAVSLLLLLLSIPFCIIKIRNEELLLTEVFGEEYNRYKKEVKALIPFIF
jgi:protein-S-isoprenylcysteine O-methyltransferase Ste14